jgi:hypothetical protein
MTQLSRAEGPFASPGGRAAGETRPVPRGRTLAGATLLLAMAGLAGCADALTDPSAAALAPRMEVSAAAFQQQYSIPVPAHSLIGTSTIGWTNTGITVPRAGKYRIRVRGAITVAQHPEYPGPCPATVLSQFLGDWGPMARPALGTHLRVAVYSQAAVDWGFPVDSIDPTTIETVQELAANTQIWVARQGLGAEVRCSAHPDPIPMFALSGSQLLTVTEVEAPKLECTGPDGATSIERGKQVRCSITPDKPYKVLSRRSSGDGFTISERPEVSFGKDVPYVWSGPAVADARVRMVLELTNDDGSRENKTYEASFTVAPRDWPKLQVNTPTVTVGLRNMTAYPPADGKGTLGNALTELDQPKVLAVRMAIPGSGPNTGLAYFVDPFPDFNFSIYLHPALFDDPANPGAPAQVWHADQNGLGSGTCTQAVFGPLVTEVRRHEGATQAPNSHWGIAQAFFQGSPVEQEVEKIYRRTTDPNVLLQAGVDRLSREMRNSLQPLQQAFDNTDTPALIAGLGCRLDHNRNDP